MLRKIDFSKDIHIVELGPGAGGITKSLLKKLSPRSRLTAFEINPTLVKKLNTIEDPRFTCINDDVENLLAYLPEESIDYIISSLPLANIGKASKTKIIDASHRALKPGGHYTQFQYSAIDLGLIKRKFPNLACDFTLLNIPPALIYYGVK
jgi:phospholipid N-methyltransferase